MIEFEMEEHEKSLLLNQLLINEYEAMIRINAETGNATTIYASDPVWEKTIGVIYPFEDTIRSYLLSHSTDSDSEALIGSIHLQSIVSDVEEKGCRRIYYTIKNDEGTFLHKKAAFFKLENRMFLTIQDISDSFLETARKLNELSDALENTNLKLERKKTFLSLLNRSVRTPLHSIMGLTKIAEYDAGNTSLEAYLHKISLSGSYMQETIDDVLELRRILSKEITLQPESVRLYGYLKNLVQNASPLLEDREILISSESDISEDLTVEVDKHALCQILTKLVQIIANLTVKGSRIQLHAHELLQSGQTVTIEFSVTCLGMMVEQEQLNHLFLAYDSLISNLNQDISTSDIALIILKSYARALGTDVLTAESNENIGVRLCLSLSLPLSRKQSLSDQSEYDSFLPRLKGLKVLIVDDNEINLDVSRKILNNQGIETVTASNGQQAVTIYTQEKGKLDLIIMDIFMPVMDGLEATRQIRAMEAIPGSDTIPIIAMTANALQENFEESFQAGMNAHLVKPINPDKLFRVMIDVLSDANS